MQRGRGTQYGNFESSLEKPDFLTTSANKSKVSNQSNNDTSMNTAKGFFEMNKQHVAKAVRAGVKGNLNAKDNISVSNQK